MKSLLLPLLFFFISFTYAQNSSLSGTITDENNVPIPGVSILLNGNKGTLTDFNGYYEFKNLQPASYSMEVSFLGYEDQTEVLELKQGETKKLNFTLETSNESLQEVEITGRKARSYKNEVTYAATKTATPIKDVPQAISYVTKEVFADQQAYRVNDIVKNVSCVNMFSYYDDFTMRGFRSGDTYIRV